MFSSRKFRRPPAPGTEAAKPGPPRCRPLRFTRWLLGTLLALHLAGYLLGTWAVHRLEQHYRQRLDALATIPLVDPARQLPVPPSGQNSVEYYIRAGQLLREASAAEDETGESPDSALEVHGPVRELLREALKHDGINWLPFYADRKAIDDVCMLNDYLQTWLLQSGETNDISSLTEATEHFIHHRRARCYSLQMWSGDLRYATRSWLAADLSSLDAGEQDQIRQRLLGCIRRLKDVDHQALRDHMLSMYLRRDLDEARSTIDGTVSSDAILKFGRVELPSLLDAASLVSPGSRRWHILHSPDSFVKVHSSVGSVEQIWKIHVLYRSRWGPSYEYEDALLACVLGLAATNFDPAHGLPDLQAMAHFSTPAPALSREGHSLVEVVHCSIAGRDLWLLGPAGLLDAVLGGGIQFKHSPDLAPLMEIVSPQHKHLHAVLCVVIAEGD